MYDMKKPTLAILPGWGGSHETWQQFMDTTRNDFDVVCIDLPCFGTEPCPSTIWGIEEYADFVKDKIDESKYPNKVILLGHSFGGQVAAFLTAKHPELIEKLILSGPALFRPKKSMRRIIFGVIAKAGKWVFKLPILERFDLTAKKLLYRAADSPDYGDTSGTKRDIFKKIIRSDLKAILPNISVPTLIIWGTNDTYVPVADGTKAAQLIPGATLHIIEGGKHGLHLQDPVGFLAVIKAFV